jgi:hypothetical protein
MILIIASLTILKHCRDSEPLFGPNKMKEFNESGLPRPCLCYNTEAIQIESNSNYPKSTTEWKDNYALEMVGFV